MPTLKQLFALAAVLLCQAVTAFAARPFPETVYDSLNQRSIFIFSDQLSSSLSEGEARFAATHFVGCQKMTRAAIDRIRQYNENFIHMHYKLAVTVDSMDIYWMVIGGEWVSNNYQEGTNWYTVRQHADWPLKNAQGQMAVHGSPYRRVIMELDNEEFRDWWVSSCIEEMTANGADGVFADTYTVPALWGRTNYPELFNDSVTVTLRDWIPKLNDYGAYVYTRLDSAGFYFYPNIDNLQTTWADPATHYWTGDSIHAAMLESWGNWSNSTDAQSAMQQVARIQNSGKFLHAESYFGPGRGPNFDLTDAQARMWLAGTYLLCNQGRMYLSMYGPSEKGLGMTGRALWFPVYEIDLGPFEKTWNSLAEQGLLWNSVFRRNYEKGFVLVNASDAARSVDLGGTFWLAEDPETTDQYWADGNGNEDVSLAYRPVASLDMPAYSAAILLDEEPACVLEPPGDYDGDGALGLPDVIALLRGLSSGAEDPCLDFNGDGRRSILDVVDLLLKISRD
ncbi:MAG: hypothetical protein FVQ81_15405 [Candidatus Glassbacteria bacterium]|nr:hypothetical protein [Candidatus Glassbacteria bacterium]